MEGRVGVGRYVFRPPGATLSVRPLHAAQDLGLHGQAASLIIVEEDPFLAELFSEHVVLGPQVVDDLLLLLVDPSGEGDEQEVPGL